MTAPPRWIPALLVLFLLGYVQPASAQEALDTAWNGREALSLVDAARAVRQASAVDSTLQGYEARA